MRLTNFSFLISFIVLFSLAYVIKVNAESTFNWQNIGYQSKPWARWWWLGSSVNEQEISRQLQELKKVGFGGVEIQSIYAETDPPIEPIQFLSKRWAEVFLFTLQEAQRLGLGVDLTLGSGWPFGGPWMQPQNAARKLEVMQYNYPEDASSRRIIDDNAHPIESVLLVPSGNASTGAQLLDYTTIDNLKCWTVPPGHWKVYVVKIGYTGQMVKRSTVGSEGPVLDHFSRAAFDNYVQPFDRMLEQIGEMRPICNFNDSYEVYGADATPELFSAFKDLQGYDLRKHIPILVDSTKAGNRQKALHDFRETIYSLYLNQFCFPWAEWSHRNHMQIRFQAHGAPGNLVDLYGLADVPETEGFGRGGIDVLVGKFASSGAHLYGREFCSAEIFTWLDEHFHVSLDMMRRSVDYFFLAGINHVFYHGVPFFQPKDPFPGPVFYASTHVGETNTWWSHLHYLNEYIARIQSAIQSYQFDPDVLLYFPIHDVWSYDKGTQELILQCEVQNANDWFQSAAPLTWKTADMLQEKGWQFDYVSDKAISDLLKTESGGLAVNTYHYKALIVAGVQRLEERTMLKIQQIADSGTKIIFIGNIPDIVERNSSLNWLPSSQKSKNEAYFQGYLNKSVFILNSVEEIPAFLKSLKIENENFAKEGIKFIRFQKSGDKLYFIKNPTNKNIDAWIDVCCQGNVVVIADPLTGKIEKPEIQRDNSKTKINISIKPQSALLLSINSDSHSEYPNFEKSDEPLSEIKLNGPWKLIWQDYDKGSHDKIITKLESWTEWEETKYYSGEMEYQTTFDLPDAATGKRFILDVGEIKESSEIIVNGKPAGAIWTVPYTIDISDKINPGNNFLQIKVRNLLANRIIDLDKRGVQWRKYFFVNIDYKPFDASQWKLLPSGLIGPVRIILSQVER